MKWTEYTGRGNHGSDGNQRNLVPCIFRPAQRRAAGSEELRKVELEMAEVKYFPFAIKGERAEEAAAALEKEERNLDRLYDAVAPDRTGYEEARTKIREKVAKEYAVEIR